MPKLGACDATVDLVYLAPADYLPKSPTKSAPIFLPLFQTQSLRAIFFAQAHNRRRPAAPARPNFNREAFSPPIIAAFFALFLGGLFYFPGHAQQFIQTFRGRLPLQ